MVTGSHESLSDGTARRPTKRIIEALGAKAEILEENPGFKAARGAAELAWRALRLDEGVQSWVSTSLKGPLRNVSQFASRLIFYVVSGI